MNLKTHCLKIILTDILYIIVSDATVMTITAFKFSIKTALF